MPVTASCSCGASYTVKDEFAGRALKCAQCGQVITAGPAVAIAIPEGDAVYARDRFLLRQKAIAINQKYYVWDEQGRPLLFIERPAHVGQSLLAALGAIATFIVLGGGIVFLLIEWLKESKMGPLQSVVAAAAVVVLLAATIAVAVVLSPKRHVNVYRDESRAERLLEIVQVNKFQVINAYFELRDQAGQLLAKFKKNYLYNIIRKRWYVYRPDGSMLAVAKEDSIILSLLRRVMGDLSFLVRTNFIILEGETENVIGEFNRKFTVLDRYVLDMSADREHHIDRRIALALGVLLDTGERR
jgi:hypothetical protein